MCTTNLSKVLVLTSCDTSHLHYFDLVQKKTRSSDKCPNHLFLSVPTATLLSSCIKKALVINGIDMLTFSLDTMRSNILMYAAHRAVMFAPPAHYLRCQALKSDVSQWTKCKSFAFLKMTGAGSMVNNPKIWAWGAGILGIVLVICGFLSQNMGDPDSDNQCKANHYTWASVIIGFIMLLAGFMTLTKMNKKPNAAAAALPPSTVMTDMGVEDVPPM